MTIQQLMDVLAKCREQVGPDAVVEIDGFDTYEWGCLEAREGFPAAVFIDTELNIDDED